MSQPPSEPVRCYLALGSNKGNRRASLQLAVDGLRRAEQVRLLRASPVYESEAHTMESGESAPPFLNAVVEVDVHCRADELLSLTQALEERAGRSGNAIRWAPRELDVDILTYGERHIDRPGLKVPHPRIAERRFVLQPLADLAPTLHVPSPYDATVESLLDRCPDTSQLHRIPLELTPNA